MSKYRIAQIDLTEKTAAEKILNEDILRSWIGGKGIGLYLLQETQGEPLLCLTGPETCKPAGRFLLGARYNGKPVFASSGGGFGTMLSRAGWDGLMLLGNAQQLSGVEITPNEIRIRSAENQQGSLTGALCQDGSSTLAIGPAGEAGSPLAVVVNDGIRAFGRHGLGAFLGQKKLKYIRITVPDAVAAGECAGCTIACPRGTGGSKHASAWNRVSENPQTAADFGILCNGLGLDAIATASALCAAKELCALGLLPADALPEDDGTQAMNRWLNRLIYPDTEALHQISLGAEALCTHYGRPELAGKRKAGKHKAGLHIEPAMAALVDALGCCLFSAASQTTRDFSLRLEQSGLHYTPQELTAIGEKICRMERE